MRWLYLKKWINEKKWNLRLNWPTFSEKRRLRPISTYNVSTVRAIEKCSIIANRKSTTRFPTSYRRSAYVTFQLPQMVVQKANLSFLWIKFKFKGIKSATELLVYCCFAVSLTTIWILFNQLSVSVTVLIPSTVTSTLTISSNPSWPSSDLATSFSALDLTVVECRPLSAIIHLILTYLLTYLKA